MSDFVIKSGRLVQGSVAEFSSKDMFGKPLLKRETGTPYVEYYIGVAVAKGAEPHWNQTDWGKVIWQTGVTGNAANYQRKDFAWKVIDGDNDVDAKGTPWRNKEGCVGHWIVRFSTEYAPTVVMASNVNQIVMDKNLIKLGDYIQVKGHVKCTARDTNPGVFVHHKVIAFLAHGEPIVKLDLSGLGTEGVTMPAGASATPIAPNIGLAAESGPNAIPQNGSASPSNNYPQSGVSNVLADAILQQEAQLNQVFATPPAPPPNPAILNVPKPKVMSPKAGGVSYEEFVKNGWTDELLIQHGYMVV